MQFNRELRIVTLLLLITVIAIVAHNGAAAAHAQEANATAAPPRLGTGLFPETTWQISSSDVAVDGSNGVHLVYVYTEPRFDPYPQGAHNPTSAVYRYCQSVCNNLQNWSSVALGQDVSEVQIGLTTAGQPRLLLLERGGSATTPQDRYVYAECSQNCSNRSSWQTASIVTVPYDLSWHWTPDPNSFDFTYREGNPRAYFQLDPAGRPRFVYLHYNSDADPNGVGAYYAACNSGCTTATNWSHTRITRMNDWTGNREWEIIDYPSLAFTPQGQPRIVAAMLPLGFLRFPGLYYIACDAGCDDIDNWFKTQIGAANDHNGYWDLAVDGNGNPHVVLATWANDQLRYGWCLSNCLDFGSFQFVHLADDVQRPDLELSPGGRPRIAHTSREYDPIEDVMHNSLYYHWCETTCQSTTAPWQSARIETGHHLLREWPATIPAACASEEADSWNMLVPSLALGPTDTVHVTGDLIYLGDCEYDSSSGSWQPGGHSTVWRAARITSFQPGVSVPTAVTLANVALRPAYQAPYLPALLFVALFTLTAGALQKPVVARREIAAVILAGHFLPILKLVARAPVALLIMTVALLSIGRLNLAQETADAAPETTVLLHTIPQREPVQSSSIKRIDTALHAGAIPRETALLYKVQAIVGDPALPQQYQEDDPSRDGTPTFAEIEAVWSTLSPAAQAALQPYLLAPSAADSWIAQQEARLRAQADDRASQPSPLSWASIAPVGSNVRVWYLPEYPFDRARAQNIADELNRHLWPTLTQLFGEPLPDCGLSCAGGGPDTRVDIYLSRVNRSYVQRHSVDASGSSTYMVLRPTASFGVLAHELMHMIQFAYPISDYREYAWILESTAHWALSYVYPAENSDPDFPLRHEEHVMAAAYLTEPNVSLEHMDDGHEYGAYLYWFFLQSPESVQAVLHNMHMTNSLQNVNEATAGHFNAAWPQFALTNWNRTPITDYQQLDELTAVAGGAQHHDILWPGELSFEIDVAHLGVRYYNFEIADGLESVHVALPVGLSGTEGAHVTALLNISDRWLPPQDWTDVQEKIFCRDNPSERVARFVLIISNSQWQNRTQRLQPGNGTIDARSTGCHAAWQGDTVGQREFFGSTLRVTLRNLTWERADPAATTPPAGSRAA